MQPETGEGTKIEETYHNAELLKKLPQGSEATAVLVGAVDFLKQPTIAFVRLAKGVMMDGIVEVRGENWKNSNNRIKIYFRNYTYRYKIYYTI